MLKQRIMIVGISLALLLILVGVWMVAAQDAADETTTEQVMPMGRFGMGMRGRGMGFQMQEHEPGAMLTVIADTLGITRGTLLDGMLNGSSISDLAEENGIELQAIADVLTATHATRLSELVASEVITQAEADARLVLMNAAILDRLESGTGFGLGGGFGMGFGGMHGGRGFGPRNGQGFGGPRGGFGLRGNAPDQSDDAAGAEDAALAAPANA